MRSSSHSRRVGGLLLAVMLVASQAAAWLHAAAVTHITCAEHGEALHAVTPAAALDDAREVPATAVATVADSDQVDTVAAHEHCATGALLRWRALTVTPPVVTVFVPPVCAALPFKTGPPAIVTAAVYRLAPKTSPPHATV